MIVSLKRSHREGMHAAAMVLLEDTLPLFQEFFVPTGYSVLVCGHFLGAAVACLYGSLLCL